MQFNVLHTADMFAGFYGTMILSIFNTISLYIVYQLTTNISLETTAGKKAV